MFHNHLIIHLPPASVARGRTERLFRKEDPARTVEKDNRSLLMHSRRVTDLAAKQATHPGVCGLLGVLHILNRNLYSIQGTDVSSICERGNLSCSSIVGCLPGMLGAQAVFPAL